MYIVTCVENNVVGRQFVFADQNEAIECACDCVAEAGDDSPRELLTEEFENVGYYDVIGGRETIYVGLSEN